MAGFAKFDPRTFLESEKRTAANKPRTLAALATLAAPPSRNENHDIGYSDVTADHRQHGKNQKSESTPAKAAKVAKVQSSEADRAMALGWGPFDLFGCDRIKPFARIDRAGLLWLLNGQKLLALAASAATIATASGGRLTFRKCLNEPGRVLAWEFDQSPITPPRLQGARHHGGKHTNTL